jgi:hypothetical protein
MMASSSAAWRRVDLSFSRVRALSITSLQGLSPFFMLFVLLMVVESHARGLEDSKWL